jgi:hypothetical protein
MPIAVATRGRVEQHHDGTAEAPASAASMPPEVGFLQRAAAPEPATAPPTNAEELAASGEASASAATSIVPLAAPPPASPTAIETLAGQLYGPLVRRLKAELLLDRERRGLRIDGV